MPRSDMRCPVCLAEWDSKALMEAGGKGCPYCHTTVMPMKTAEDVTLRLNWQDLRVLAIYSKRWTTFFDLTKKVDQDCLKAFNRLIEKLLMLQPYGSLPLTIEGEVVKAILPKGNDADLLKEQGKSIGLVKDAHGNILSPFMGLPPLS